MVSKKNILMPIKIKNLNFEKGHRKLLTDISCKIKARYHNYFRSKWCWQNFIFKMFTWINKYSTSEITFANKTLNTSIRKQQSMVFQSLYY